MKKVVKFISLPLLMLALYIFPVEVNAAEKNINNKVSEAEIQNILKQHFKEVFNLDDRTYKVSLTKPVYDINDEIIANYFEIRTNTNEHYFILISTSSEYSSIFASGEDTAEFFILNEDATKYYFVGGYTLIKADNSEELINYVSQKKKESSLTSEIKESLKLQKNPDRLKESNLDSVNVNNFNLITPTSVGNTTLSTMRYSQYDSGINSLYRNSACGPTTMAVILQYWHDSRSKTNLNVYNSGYNSQGAFVNYLYYYRGGRPIGMTVGGVSVNLNNEATARGYSSTSNSFNNFNSYITEIEAMRPVAIKFDTYFTLFEPTADYAFNYHWTPGHGYVSSSSAKLLTVQTLNSSQSIKNFDYTTNSPIITMVNFNIQ